MCLTESGHGDKRLGIAVFLKNFASGGGGFIAARRMLRIFFEKLKLINIEKTMHPTFQILNTYQKNKTSNKI